MTFVAQTTPDVHYFGYGALREKTLLAEILGKNPEELIGQPVTLLDYELAIQELEDVPDSALPQAPDALSPRDILKRNWPQGDFKSYVLVPRAGKSVAGIAWELNEAERELLKKWELVDFGWLQEAFGIAITTSGERLQVTTEQIGDAQTVSQYVDGLNYESYLGEPTRLLEIAKKSHSDQKEE